MGNRGDTPSMNLAFRVNLPKGDCINCGPVVVYVDDVEGGDWARCVRCDQMIGPWRDIHAVVAADDLASVGMAVVESACNCGVGEGCSSCSMNPEGSCG